MPFLRWCPQKQSLQPTSAQGLPIKEVQRSLGNIQRIMTDPQVTLRFHALTKAKEGQETAQAIPWLWTVSLRVSPELWHELNRLSYHSIWQLIQIRLRPQPLDRQPFGQAVAEGVVRLIPVFLNPTGTICFANTAILCLAWMTLLADGFHPQLWTTGFELLRNVYQAAHRPMDLLNHNPFLWLLMGSWTVDRLHHQQDVCEFLIYLLSLMRPKFLHCEWVTKVALTATPSDQLLEWEKGQQFTPILLQYINHHAAECQLQDLVHQWHDPQGFCRAASEVGQTLILMIDRFNPETQLKCQQFIRFGDQIGISMFSG